MKLHRFSFVEELPGGYFKGTVFTVNEAGTLVHCDVTRTDKADSAAAFLPERGDQPARQIFDRRGYSFQWGRKRGDNARRFARVVDAAASSREDFEQLAGTQ